MLTADRGLQVTVAEDFEIEYFPGFKVVTNTQGFGDPFISILYQCGTAEPTGPEVMEVMARANSGLAFVQIPLTAVAVSDSTAAAAIVRPHSPPSRFASAGFHTQTEDRHHGMPVPMTTPRFHHDAPGHIQHYPASGDCGSRVFDSLLTPPLVMDEHEARTERCCTPCVPPRLLLPVQRVGHACRRRWGSRTACALPARRRRRRASCSAPRP